jgi:hypothetical protein
MARVEEWFPTFMMNLMIRSGRQDWPDPEDEVGVEFWADFKRALIRCGASEEEADEASSAACDVPDLWPNQYRPMVVAAIKSLQSRKQAEGKGSGGPNSMDEAKATSKGCPDCDGNGIAMRYIYADYLGRFVTPGGKPFPLGALVGIVCGSCPLGNLIWRLNSEAPRENRHRMAFGKNFPDLLSGRQYRYPPDNWNALDGEPMPEPSPEDVKAQVQADKIAGKGPRSLVVASGGSRWSKASWADERHRTEAQEGRLEEAVAGAVPMSAPPAEYPDLSEAAAMPTDPVRSADETGWF